MNANRSPCWRRENIGFVFQKSNLIPFLNAVENVQVVGELIGRTPAVARRRAMALLDALGVGARAGQRSPASSWPTNRLLPSTACADGR